MSKRITIVLSDEEYAVLEQRAQQDRRSVRDMAARFVTQGQDIRFIPVAPTSPPIMPWQNPVISSPNTVGSGSTTYDPNRITVWNAESQVQ